MKSIYIVLSCLSAVLLLPAALSGQTGGLKDTIRIGEIVIKEERLSSAVKGFRKTTLDSAVISDYSLDNLSDIISENTTLTVKDYGPGSISTISFRRAGAGHTDLLWNGLSIKSPMLGQADLSLIPAGFIDKIGVYHGGASMVLGAGGLGGSINIETKPEWERGTSAYLDAGAGSFGRYSGLLKIRAGNSKLQSVTKAYFNSADNDFIYLNTAGYSGPVEEKRRNAGVTQHSLMQELYFRHASSLTTAGIWYSKSRRELPSSLLVAQPDGNEKQSDESLRLTLEHSIFRGHFNIDNSVAWLSDNLSYVNKAVSVDSRNQTNSLVLRSSVEKRTVLGTHIRIFASDELNMVNSNNYAGFTSRNLLNAGISVRQEFNKNMGVFILVREVLDNRKLLLPDFSAAMDVSLSKVADADLKINLSRNSKVPSMNDRYWNPGGNPGLKNEYSYTGEISAEFKEQTGKSVKLESDLTLFAGRILDMIQWVPGEFSYWSPANIARVGTYGLEAGLGFEMSINKLIMKFKGQYVYTHAEDISDDAAGKGKQMVYVPANQITGNFNLCLSNFHAGIAASLTGRRFTDADNSDFLKACMLTNLSAGYKINTGNNSLGLSIRLENLFDASYEVMAYYPMPGRSFLASVTYLFGR